MYHSFLVHSSADGHLGCFHSQDCFPFKTPQPGGSARAWPRVAQRTACGWSGASLGGNKCALAQPSVVLRERRWPHESALSRKLAEGVPASGWLGRGLGPLTKEKRRRVLSSRPHGAAQLCKGLTSSTESHLCAASWEVSRLALGGEG